MDVQDVLLELKDISKSFGEVSVLEGVDMFIKRGRIYALAGENGAGKSTLCNIISGSLSPSGGKLVFDGEEHNSFDIIQAKEKIGVRMVHQELHILPLMTISENIFIGDEIRQYGFVDKKAMNEKSAEVLEMVGLSLEPTTMVKDVEIAGRQLIEIARGINGKAQLIILDEPTSSLSSAENEKLFEIMNKLKNQGISFIFISHRLEEMLEIADEILVLKDGKKVQELDAKKTNQDEIIKHMVGRNYDDYYKRERTFKGKELFRVKNLSTAPVKQKNNAYLPQEVSFSLEEGEVLGIAGLVGAGRTELIRTIFGDLKIAAGEIIVDGKEVRIHDSSAALELGLAWVTEDRKQQGVVLSASIRDNMSLVVLKNFAKILIDDKAVTSLAHEYIERLQIKATNSEQVVSSLSGGNQQKVVLGKWLAANPRILVLDEPTRGIDVGAKAEIYKLINQLTAKGIAVIMISSELPEIIGMSDRMLIMYEGKIQGELTRKDFSEESIMKYATGRSKGSEY